MTRQTKLNFTVAKGDNSNNLVTAFWGDVPIDSVQVPKRSNIHDILDFFERVFAVVIE